MLCYSRLLRQALCLREPRQPHRWCSNQQTALVGKTWGWGEGRYSTPQPSGEEAELVRGIAPQLRRGGPQAGVASVARGTPNITSPTSQPHKPAPLAAQDHCKPFRDPRGATKAASQGEKPAAGQRKSGHTLLLPKQPHFSTT